MAIEDIKALPVADLAAKDSVLFLWGTWPKLPEAMSVIEAWGFKYRTVAFVWIKTNKRVNVEQGSFFPVDSFDEFFGLGYWTRANSEFCLLATKGQPKKISNYVRQIIYSPLREHSRKPDEARTRIVELLGDVPRIELFARQEAVGWDSWGNEVESDIDIPQGEAI